MAKTNQNKDQNLSSNSAAGGLATDTDKSVLDSDDTPRTKKKNGSSHISTSPSSGTMITGSQFIKNYGDVAGSYSAKAGYNGHKDNNGHKNGHIQIEKNGHIEITGAKFVKVSRNGGLEPETPSPESAKGLYEKINGLNGSNSHAIYEALLRRKRKQPITEAKAVNGGATESKSQVEGEDVGEQNVKLSDMKQEIKAFFASDEVKIETSPAIIAMDKIELIKKFGLLHRIPKSYTLKQKEYLTFYENLNDVDRTCELANLNKLIGITYP